MERFTSLLVNILLLSACALAQAPASQTATILDIQSRGTHSAVHKATDAPPPASPEGDYNITVQIGDMVYVGHYQHASDFVPSNWQVGKPVEARVGPHKHRIYLKDVSGKEVALPIVTRHPAKQAAPVK
jgi:hypothetical protein